MYAKIVLKKLKSTKEWSLQGNIEQVHNTCSRVCALHIASEAHKDLYKIRALKVGPIAMWCPHKWGGSTW